jgi:hypothetical protein
VEYICHWAILSQLNPTHQRTNYIPSTSSILFLHVALSHPLHSSIYSYTLYKTIMHATSFLCC